MESLLAQARGITAAGDIRIMAADSITADTTAAVMLAARMKDADSLAGVTKGVVQPLVSMAEVATTVPAGSSR